ncbi:MULTISPECIES: hypothetical protein [Anaerotruncus]|jgi:hypothetical protein|uniref:hypothetical protein n=1 Tax=Anaerotruncus TaxID=244127 RepID=UPI0008329814|nr:MULTISPECIES: hypothetical protein [Anaerotruncus]RGX54617.1 hypothetical protein DWV16_13250 [Anaerotruncus sp. AF02-27]
MSDPKTPKSAHPFDADDGRDLFDDLFSVASATECTGLIPAAPADEPEVDSYSEIYDIPLSHEKVNRGLQNIKKTTETPGIPD